MWDEFTELCNQNGPRGRTKLKKITGKNWAFCIEIRTFGPVSPTVNQPWLTNNFYIKWKQNAAGHIFAFKLCQFQSILPHFQCDLLLLQWFLTWCCIFDDFVSSQARHYIGKIVQHLSLLKKSKIFKFWFPNNIKFCRVTSFFHDKIRAICKKVFCFVTKANLSS